MPLLDGFHQMLAHQWLVVGVQRSGRLLVQLGIELQGKVVLSGGKLYLVLKLVHLSLS